jgi:hypothetical protein
MSTDGQNPSGQATVPPPVVPTADASSNGLLTAGIVGSGVALIGSFLGWVTPDGAEETIRGTDGDGMFTLITSAIAVALLVFGLVRKNGKIASFSAIPSLLTLGIGVFNFLDPARLARSWIESQPEAQGMPAQEIDTMVEGIDWTAAAGLWIVLVGALAGVVVGVMAGLKARATAP